jgi:hypothetical protein
MREAFHDSFLAAVAGDVVALEPWASGPAAETGLSVYRNTMAKGCADALVAQFPTIERVVGPSWLAAAAVAHAVDHPPRRAALVAYGEDFPAWLASFPPAVEMPFLSGLARLDWAWTLAHLAPDREPLAADALTALEPEDFAVLGLQLHPALQVCRFEDSTPSLWRALQPPGDAPSDLLLDDVAENMAFVRPGLVVEATSLTPGAVALIEASGQGLSLAEAAIAALKAEPSIPLSQTFADLIGAGAFTALRSLS